MAYYYNANEDIKFKSGFKALTNYPEYVFWIECISDNRSSEQLESYNKISFYLKKLTGSIEGNLNNTLHYTIDGKEYSKEFRNLSSNSGYYYCDESVYIPHDLSGNKKLTITAYFEGTPYNSDVLTLTIDLPKIPQPAEMTVDSNIEVGDVFDIVVEPDLDGCEYELRYKFDYEDEYYNYVTGSRKSSVGIDTIYVCDFLTLNPDKAGYSEFYNACRYAYEDKESGSFSIRCYTKDNNYGYGWIGYTYKTVNFTIPKSVKPVVNHLVCDIMNPNCLEPDFTGSPSYSRYQAESYGYVKNLCRARLFICVDDYKSKRTNASRLESYRVWSVDKNGTERLIKTAYFEADEDGNEVFHDYFWGPSTQEGYSYYNHLNYDCDSYGDGIEVVTDVLDTAGDITYYATVTDRRGRTSEPVSVTITVVDYNQPVVSSLSATRCDSTGTYPQEDGNYIICYYSASIPSNNVGTYILNVYEGIDTSTEPIETYYLANSSTTLNGQKLLTNKPNNFDYCIELIVDDSNVRITKTVVVRATNALIDFAPDGSVAIGKVASTTYADTPTFEVNMLQKNYNSIVLNKNNAHDLGDEWFRWRTIYSVNVLNTSDMTYKENISYVNPSNKVRSGEEIITQEDLHNFYKSDYQLATYNYIGQEQAEYGFITQDMYNNIVGESLIIRNENGDMFSINSYISSIAGALQYEINLRDEQIAALLERIEALENGD